MRSRPHVVALGAWLTVLLGTCEAVSADDEPGLFENTVRPILTDTCLACHGPDTKKGGLDLSRRASAITGGDSGEAIVAGKAEESLLFEKIAAGEMPPRKPLKPDDVAAFKSWIETGAHYTSEPLAQRRAGADWWSLRPIRRPDLPSVKGVEWVRNPIDAFVLAKLEESGLEPAPAASRRDFVRRATFDLTGLPPTPEEIEAFEADQRPDAHERLVDRLLASPAYGERWARHWMDVVRFAESNGYETNALRPNAWPYRDWAIRAFNQDVPFERFVAAQLAGDGLADADWLTQAATGFLVGGTHDIVKNLSLEGMLQQRVDDLDDMITATSTAFLGLTANCARCHDHKFDPILQSDYYGLSAVFAGVQHADRGVPAPDAEARAIEAARLRAELASVERELDAHEPLARLDLGKPGRPTVNARRNVERFEPVSGRYVRLTIQATNDGTEPCIDELEVWTTGAAPRNVALGATASASSTYPNSTSHQLAHLNDGRYGNDQSWISAVKGKGWAQVDLGRVETIGRIVWGRDRQERYKDRVPSEYYFEVADAPGNWRVVASSADRPSSPKDAQAGPAPAQSPQAGASDGTKALRERQTALRKRVAALGPTMPIYAGTFLEPEPTHVLRRGDPLQKLDPVAPSGIRAVRPALAISPGAPERERRQALAAWITDPANPLSWRVMVNRVWQFHLGQGIVNTPSDFGFNGDRPSHPELLDWLAAEFQSNGGHLKPLHRLILLSATYRESNRFDARAANLDRANRLLWRYSPRRLEAEEVRDSLLALSGSLDRRMGGPGYWIWEPNTNYVVVFKNLEELGPEHFRRMVYMYKPRSQQDPTFGAFDCPDGGLVTPRRNVSTTALQALNLFNSRFVLDQSERFAERLKREAGEDAAAQARRAFRLAFGRAPSTAELDGATRLIEEHGGAALCRALYNANEFLFMP